MKILKKITKEIIYEDDSPTMGETVKNAVKKDVSLDYADLSGEDLSHANLHSANLRNANLSNADLRGADLRYANLCKADLREANLYGADLRGVDLSYANLYGTNLREADLFQADLSYANLYGVDLYGAGLYESDGIISIGPIGKHRRTIYAYRHIDDMVYVTTNWFDGTLDEFANVVIDKYGDNRAEYDAAVKLINAKFL